MGSVNSTSFRPILTTNTGFTFGYTSGAYSPGNFGMFSAMNCRNVRARSG